MNTETETNNSRVLFHTSSIAVVNKRIGEVCETSSKDPALSLIQNTRAELEIAFGCASPDMQAVHRIDQPVSGCVLVARTSEMCATLSADFSTRKVLKRYIAITELPPGGLTETSGRLEHLLWFDTKHHKAQVFLAEDVQNLHSGWKESSLEWRLVGKGDRYLFLEITPFTGRTHQIRAQLAAAGMPIKGDLKYGARRSDPLGGIRLHASRIEFYNPESNELCSVSAPIIEPDNLWLAFPELDINC